MAGNALEHVQGINFRVEVLSIRDGRKLGKARADEHGYYDMPLAALGVATRNKTYYETRPFVDQITSRESRFNEVLTDGTLYGEYGHPNLVGMDNNAALARLAHIDEDRVSHHFRTVEAGKRLGSGGVLGTGMVRPTGRRGAYLQANLDDPFMNTAFSLRAITDARFEGGLSRRNMKKLVTFDAVLAGGFAEASKRYAPAVEAYGQRGEDGLSFTYDLPIARGPQGRAALSSVAMENFTDSELNEIFGAKEVTILSKSVTVLNGGQALMRDNQLLSTYHTLLTVG